MSWEGRLLPAVAAASCFVLGLAATAVARRVALRIGFVDRPGGHKSHTAVIPYGGGSAILLAAWAPIAALVAGALLTPPETIESWFGVAVRDYVGGIASRATPTLVLLGGALVLHLMGLRDDLRPLGPYTKLAVIAVVAFCVAQFGDVRVAILLGPGSSLAITVAWIVIVTNAFNFLDNMDGLSAGVACICCAVLVACGMIAGQVLVPSLAGMFAGAIAGFLVFNFPPARIFMGDGGSLVIGYMLAVVSVLTTYYDTGGGRPPFSLAMPVIVLAVPLYDFVSVVVIRLLEGKNPMKGDQRHFSHRLVDRGLSRRAAVLTIYLATAATAILATLLPTAGLAQTLTILTSVVLVLSMIATLEMPLRKRT